MTDGAVLAYQLHKTLAWRDGVTSEKIWLSGQAEEGITSQHQQDA